GAGVVSMTGRASSFIGSPLFFLKGWEGGAGAPSWQDGAPGAWSNYKKTCATGRAECDERSFPGTGVQENPDKAQARAHNRKTRCHAASIRQPVWTRIQFCPAQQALAEPRKQRGYLQPPAVGPDQCRLARQS